MPFRVFFNRGCARITPLDPDGYRQQEKCRTNGGFGRREFRRSLFLPDVQKSRFLRLFVLLPAYVRNAGKAGNSLKPGSRAMAKVVLNNQ